MKESLINRAIESMKHAYAPYSNFPVGAALVTTEGTIYTGINVENVAYGSSCCAERVAIFSAIKEGERDFAGIAVAARTKRPVPPCGACRQVMSEFFDEHMPIYLVSETRETFTFTMDELLPFSFSPIDLTD
ncbi:MAG TPA: cytidine deaminase [Bacillota bacterium]|nr:cytidine deaminase [Bacillota bacterium]